MPDQPTVDDQGPALFDDDQQPHAHVTDATEGEVRVALFYAHRAGKHFTLTVEGCALCKRQTSACQEHTP